jgi:hypothetical protein
VIKLGVKKKVKHLIMWDVGSIDISKKKIYNVYSYGSKRKYNPFGYDWPLTNNYLSIPHFLVLIQNFLDSCYL